MLVNFEISGGGNGSSARAAIGGVVAGEDGDSNGVDDNGKANLLPDTSTIAIFQRACGGGDRDLGGENDDGDDGDLDGEDDVWLSLAIMGSVLPSGFATGDGPLFTVWVVVLSGVIWKWRL
ncbi:hypothetical protein SUGI_0838710 [Cryptomeria japonica]|nr:hypothetical protein SUGI_0838710 [Cryptomeria japonica]